MDSTPGAAAVKVLQTTWEWIDMCNGGDTRGLETWPLLPVVGGGLVPATWASRVLDWDTSELTSVATAQLLQKLGIRCVDYSTSVRLPPSALRTCTYPRGMQYLVKALLGVAGGSAIGEVECEGVGNRVG